jgi:hypothetical protein
MSANGQAQPRWGYAVEGKPTTMLEIALRSFGRQGHAPQLLPTCNGQPCQWARDVATYLSKGECRIAVLFCLDSCLACCVANKVPGVRAAAVSSVPQASRALRQLGANLLVVEMAGRTYYECRELLKLCYERPSACPDGLACVLEELDGHAHR